MHTYRALLALTVLALVLMAGCTSGGGGPTMPGTTSGPGPGLTGNDNSGTGQYVNETTQKALWGMWNVEYDFTAGKLVVSPYRGADFRANVNTFMNKGPYLKPIILDDSTLMTDGKILVDVGLEHPFPGLYMYSGMDVIGIFMHNGSGNLGYNGYAHAEPGTETDGILWNADGYSLWWNANDFLGSGLLGYTPGNLGNPIEFSASINPYRNFADGLLNEDDYATFLDDPAMIARRGAFIAGSTNFRLYDLQFPMSGGSPVVQFQYAVAASWEEPTLSGDNFIVSGGGEDWEYFDSAVAEEAICLSVIDTSGLFNDGVNAGGSIMFDLEIFDWGALSATIAEEIGMLQIECDLFTAPFNYDQPTLAGMLMPGGALSSTVSFDLACDPPPNTDPVDVWIIAEQAVGTYENDFGVPAPADKLASFYRMWVPVDAVGTVPPVYVSGVDGQSPGCAASVSDYTVVFSGIVTDYMWSVVPTGDPPDYSIVDDDVLSFDFGTVTGPADFDINCRAFSGPAFTDAVLLTVSVPTNNAPIIVNGVNGPSTVLPTYIKEYTLYAKDNSAPVNFYETDFTDGAGWVLQPNWMVYGGRLTADGIVGQYGLNAFAALLNIPVPAIASMLEIGYSSNLTIDAADQGCSYDIAQLQLNADGGPMMDASVFGTQDQPPYDCSPGWGSNYPDQNTIWAIEPGFGGYDLGLKFYLETNDMVNNNGDWNIDDLYIAYRWPCDDLTYMWSVVFNGAAPNYVIPDPGDDGSLDIDWSVYGLGLYDVNCQVSDGVTAVEATVKTVLVTNALPIREDDDGTPGPGVKTLTGAGEAVDISAREADGGAYVAYYTGSVYVHRLDEKDPTMSTTVRSVTITTSIAQPHYSDMQGHGDLFVDSALSGGTTYITETHENIWHIQPRWDFGTVWFNGFIYYIFHAMDCTSSGDGISSAYVSQEFNTERLHDVSFHPPDGLSVSPSGNMYVWNTTGDLEFDGSWGSSDHNIVGMAAGDDKFELWGLGKIAPKIRQYSQDKAIEYSSFAGLGPDGTGDGEVSTPIDITMSDDDGFIYVMDEPSAGLTRIQLFTEAGGWIASSLPTDASGNGGGAPYRLDYCEFDDRIYVLYDNNTMQVWAYFP